MICVKSLARACLLVLCFVYACGSPCEDLSKKICGCDPNHNNVQNCKNRVANDIKSASLSSQEEQQCSNWLDTCTCDALQAGNFAACGLSNDPSPTPRSVP